jgi:hypothetical protein
MNSSLTLGGFLGGFLLAGIFLPIAVSFVADGVVVYFRGRGATRLVLAAAVVISIISLYPIALQNAADVGSAQQMTGAIGLILWFSVPAAALGFGVRMMALALDPTTKATDRAAIAQRAGRHAARIDARNAASRGELTRHA